MAWALVITLFVALCGSVFLLWRATSRLLQFDSIFQMIIEPMHEYSNVLRKLTSGEGVLHDHPEVMQFHKANVGLLRSIDAAIQAVKLERPEKKKRDKLPRPEVA